MKRLHRFAAFVVLIGLSLCVSRPVWAADEIPLATVAAQLGYDYSYIGEDDAVVLRRPGVTILVRPGERLYDVNDRTESMNGMPPRFRQNDLFVSSSFVTRLRQIAARYPAERAVSVSQNQSFAPSTALRGAISMSVRQLPGTQSLSVSGRAPAGAPITLTLIGTFSAEIPDVIVSRNDVSADSRGEFQSVVPIVPGSFRGGILTLVATSVPGVTKASARVEAGPPNGSVSVPADYVPRSVR